MADTAPILGLSGVRCAVVTGSLVELALRPGDLALIDARDTALATNFADLCCGLHPPEAGSVCFLGRDWTQQPPELTDALRARIGRVFDNPGWLQFLDATTNILLAQLHHTRTGIETLRAEAVELAHHFGLPGMPCGPIANLSHGDLTRASFVRAFLGTPKLVILESPVQGTQPDLVLALLNQIAVVRNQGGAAIWLTRSRMTWENRRFPATQRLRLDHHGLSTIKAAA
jgi:phospholipid/cholesterol/gamma-HCH transport system ATP-binding protein